MSGMKPTDSPYTDPDFNPYAAPTAKVGRSPLMGGPGLWREGNRLVMRKDAELPDRCVRCNEPAHGYRLKRRLSWHHPAFYLFLLFNLIIYVIVALIVRKTAKIEVGLCEAHVRARTRAILVGWLGSLGGIGLMIFGAMNSGPGAQNDLGWMILVGLLLLLVSLIFGASKAPPVVPTRIDANFVWLKRVSPAFLAALPDVPPPTTPPQTA